MKQFLAFVRKADFVDLFKYGSLHVNKDTIRQFSCKVSELSHRECVFNDLIYFSNAFDSTFEYLIIHYNKSNGRDNDITISDVQGIYPLDNEAKTELSLTLDQRIEIHNPIWPNAVYSLQKKHTFNNCLTGVSNIWKIYHIVDSIDSVSSIINNSILKEVIDETYDNRHPYGDLPIWVYIMKYERHAFYPDNTVGCFMDTINAVFNFMQQREVDSTEIEGTKIMQYLEFCNHQPENKKTFDNILQALDKEPAVENMIAKIKEIEPSCNLLKVATLFFIFRNRYKEELIFERRYQEAGLKHGFDFSVACYMLGFILGHEHTYDCLYSCLPLNIFKHTSLHNDDNQASSMNASVISWNLKGDYEPSFREKQDIQNNIKDNAETSSFPSMVNEDDEIIHSKINRNITNKESDVVSNNASNNLCLFANEGKLLQEPIPMKKGPRGRKIVYVSTEEEYLAKLDIGYIQAVPKSSSKSKRSNK